MDFFSGFKWAVPTAGSPAICRMITGFSFMLQHIMKNLSYRFQDYPTDILNLAEFLLDGGIPAKARMDALHIACATYHQMDILLT